MANKKHYISLTQDLYESLLNKRDKRILYSGDEIINDGDLIRISETAGETNITTGQGSDWVAVHVAPLYSTAFNNLSMISLQRDFPMQVKKQF